VKRFKARFVSDQIWPNLVIRLVGDLGARVKRAQVRLSVEQAIQLTPLRQLLSTQGPSSSSRPENPEPLLRSARPLNLPSSRLSVQGWRGIPSCRATALFDNRLGLEARGQHSKFFVGHHSCGLTRGQPAHAPGSPPAQTPPVPRKCGRWTCWPYRWL